MPESDLETFESGQTKRGQYTLGPLPWSREQLVRDFWSNFIASFEHTKEHPGFGANQALEDIQNILEVFFDSGEDLFAAISAFRQQAEADGAKFYARGNQWRVKELERGVR